MLIICMFQDYSAGFGGKYGVQKDRQDKAAHTWEDHEALAKHESQKGDRSSWKMIGKRGY